MLGLLALCCAGSACLFLVDQPREGARRARQGMLGLLAKSCSSRGMLGSPGARSVETGAAAS